MTIRPGRFRSETESLILTPDHAHDLVNEKNFERNRPVRQTCVDEYAKLISEGRFSSGSPLVVAAVDDPEGYHLLNGQHRCLAVIKADTDLAVSLITYYLENEEELHELYATIDVNIPRTLSDNIRAQGVPQEVNLNFEQTNRTAYGVLAATQGGKYLHSKARRHRLAEDARAVIDWKEEAQAYWATTRQMPKTLRGLCRRASMVGLGLLTIRAGGRKGVDFWEGVWHNAELEANDPRSRLHNQLTDFVVDVKAGTRSFEGPDHNFVICLTCGAWNNFYRGKSIKSLRPVNDPHLVGCNWPDFTPDQKRASSAWKTRRRQGKAVAAGGGA